MFNHAALTTADRESIVREYEALRSKLAQKGVHGAGKAASEALRVKYGPARRTIEVWRQLLTSGKRVPGRSDQEKQADESARVALLENLRGRRAAAFEVRCAAVAQVTGVPRTGRFSLIRAVAKRFNIGVASLYRWCSAYSARGKEGLIDRRWRLV